MVDFDARYDPGDGAVYLSAVAGYTIPDELWSMLRAAPYFGQYKTGRARELRLTREAAASAVDALRSDGHSVTTTTGARALSAIGRAGPPECQTCHAPYPAGYVVRPEQMCRNPATVRHRTSGDLVPEYEPHLLVLGPPPA